jgi:sugar phosphate isomerase/epimerase
LSTGFAAPEPIVDILVRSASLGYEGLEILVSRLIASGESAAEVATMARRARMGLTLHAPIGPINLAAAEAAERERARRSAFESLELAVELGASLVVLHPGRVPDEHDDEFAWGQTFAALDELAPRAERLGVRIGVENMEHRPREVVNTPADCRRLLDPYAGTPIGLTIDFAHAWTHGLVDAFLDLVPRAINVHMSDASAEQTHVAAWGGGAVAIARVCRALGQARYGGAVVIEGTARDGPWDVAAANLRRWREWTD